MAVGRPKPGPSIGDVARLAGVSAQTVSRVSTGAVPVRPETRRRVLAAMTELGYSPNMAARALRYGSFGTIGVIAHRLNRTGEFSTVEAVVEAARRESYVVTLMELETPSLADVSQAVARLSHVSVDGLIVIRAERGTPDTLALPPGLPLVVSDSRFAGAHPTVGADHAGGAAAAVRHLLDLGHATVHHLAGPADSDPASVRLTAWRNELARAGLAAPEVLAGDWSAQSGYQAGLEIARRRDVTAVFAANDEMAIGLVRALHEVGRPVPGEVSVVGFDDIPLAGYLWPPLTTVRQDYDGIGQNLIALLLRQMRDGPSGQLDRVLIPAELVIRSSTAPPA
jgi:DNA-binding LacI/PurR family transcriptional regulator